MAMEGVGIQDIPQWYTMSSIQGTTVRCDTVYSYSSHTRLSYMYVYPGTYCTCT